MRLGYIDWLKAIAIWLIVLGHIPLKAESVGLWVHTFHVPLFFFISGYLYKKKDSDLIPYLKVNIRTLILVGISYYIINTFFEYIQVIGGQQIGVSLKDKVRHILLIDNKIGPIWFLFSLFWMRISFFLLYSQWAIKPQKILLGSLFLAFIFYYSPCQTPNFQVFTSVICFPFYVLGFILKKTELVNAFKKDILYSTSLFLLISVLGSIYCGEVNINGLKFSKNIIYFYTIALSGVFFSLSLSLSLKSTPRIVISISNGTLVILGLHGILVQIFKYLYKGFFHISSSPPYIGLLWGVIISFLILIILYPLIDIIISSKYTIVRFFAGKK